MGIKERKSREKNLRRKEILNAAKKLFGEKGFYSATIEDIAKKAELSPATIYLYFKNKEELYANLNLNALWYLDRKVRNITENDRLTVEEKIFYFKDAFYDTYRYDPLVWHNIFDIQLEDPSLMISDEMQEQLTGVIRDILVLMCKTYEEGVHQGIFIERQGMAIADTIWGLISGLVSLEESKKKLNSKKDFLKSTLDTSFQVLIQGLKSSKKWQG